MRRIVWWTALVMLSARVVSAEPLSPKLAMAGIITAAAGIGMMAPYGEEYHVFDRTYCVANSYTLDRGKCEQPTAAVITAGKWVLAAGLGMTALGFWPKRVTVAPMIGPHVKGVAGRVRW